MLGLRLAALLCLLLGGVGHAQVLTGGGNGGGGASTAVDFTALADQFLIGVDSDSFRQDSILTKSNRNLTVNGSITVNSTFTANGLCTAASCAATLHISSGQFIFDGITNQNSYIGYVPGGISSFTFLNSGFLGIGSVANAKLHVSSGSILIDGSGASLIFPDGTSQTTASTGEGNTYASSKTFYGNVGVGGPNVTNTRLLHVSSGPVYIDGVNPSVNPFAVNVTSFVITPAGRVGIGVAAPSAKLTVTDAAAANINIDGGSSDPALLFTLAGSPSSIAQKSGTGVLNQRMVQTSISGTILTHLDSGNFGINVVTPTGRLHISSGGAVPAIVVDGNNGIPIKIGLGFTTASTMTLTSDGNFWVPKASATFNTLYQYQASCSTGLTSDASGGINGCVASDSRLKTDILYAVTRPGLIDQLKPTFYKWKGKNKDKKTHYGFIAQDVAEVFPDAVVPAGGAMRGLDSNALIAITVSELQSLRHRVATLEGRK